MQSDHLSFYAVLLSAVLHAIWNLAAKKTPHKGAFIWLITIWGSLFLLPFAIYFEGAQLRFDSRIWLFPALSVFSHSLYSFCLAESYRHVPFSVAYPVARGLAQVFIVIVGLVVFKEQPGILAMMGVVLILIGIQATAAGNFFERIRLLIHSPWPLYVALCICFYTSIDHQSVKVLPPMTICLISNIGQVCILARIQGREFFQLAAPERKAMVKQTIFWGVASTLGYTLFLWAQHIGGFISVLGPLRETSVFIGMLLSFIVLKEVFRWQKIWAALMIVIGIFLLRQT